MSERMHVTSAKNPQMFPDLGSQLTLFLGIWFSMSSDTKYPMDLAKNRNPISIELRPNYIKMGSIMLAR